MKSPTSILDTTSIIYEKLGCCFFFGGMIDGELSNTLYQFFPQSKKLQSCMSGKIYRFSHDL